MHVLEPLYTSVVNDKYLPKIKTKKEDIRFRKILFYYEQKKETISTMLHMSWWASQANTVSSSHVTKREWNYSFSYFNKNIQDILCSKYVFLWLRESYYYTFSNKRLYIDKLLNIIRIYVYWRQETNSLFSKRNV